MEHNRELYFSPPHMKQTKVRQHYPTLTLRYVCDSLYLTKELEKIFNEYGLDFDNNKYGLGQSSEIEYTDGTESRTNKKS